MRNLSIFIPSLMLFVFSGSRVNAGHVMVDTTVDGLKIELHVLAAEPFFTKEQMAANKITEGMLILGGAAPLALTAKPTPNHHLVVHVFNTKSGKALTNAKVKIRFQAFPDSGKKSAQPTNVPIVVMQAIGKGEQSTHYGNNVMMSDGVYTVSVIVNGKKTAFKITVAIAADDSMKGMDMH
jgi:hypothetical protein